MSTRDQVATLARQAGIELTPWQLDLLDRFWSADPTTGHGPRSVSPPDPPRPRRLSRARASGDDLAQRCASCGAWRLRGSTCSTCELLAGASA